MSIAPDLVSDAVIRIRALSSRFGANVVHDGLDLDVMRGEIMGVVGGSGTGKSVLLRTIIGLNRPAAGGIEIFDQKEVCKPTPPLLTPRRPLRHGQGQQRLHGRQRDLSHDPPALHRVQLQRQS